MADDIKLIYQLHERLELAHKGHEALRLVAEMDEDDKKAIMHLVAYVASQKGPDLKQVLSDVRDAAWPKRRIENDGTVEQEAIDLKNELGAIGRATKQLSLFSDAFMDDLRERAYEAEERAAEIRRERARLKKEQEEAIRGGAIAFPDSEAG